MRTIDRLPLALAEAMNVLGTKKRPDGFVERIMSAVTTEVKLPYRVRVRSDIIGDAP
jgi:hypothetical protein